MSYPTYHSVFLHLEGRSCLVVGGGPIAVEKITGLKDAGARVTVIAPQALDTISDWHEADEVEWLAREFVPEDVLPFFLVIGATDDMEVNREVYEAGNRLNRLANAVDDPDYCNFIMAAMVRRGPVQVAVSSSGCSPALAQKIRNRIANEILEPETGLLAEFLGSWRPAVKDRLAGYGVRKSFWEDVLASAVPGFIADGNALAADAEMERLLDTAAAGQRRVS
ncbi:MAG: bifunctional precorrin-2 dehydrogenase/sirohydrochlorin ferrochelatase [Armatimonadetes bacterium]|nr:bifunctional precorrin-2 dehydrogenase/sirohydrochlorin ferrochelatase [Armatimonadota bacterium]